MSFVVRVFVKTALAYLMAALILGALLMASNVIPMPFSSAVINPVYVHLLVIGWITQLIFGVAWWMFPVISREKLQKGEWTLWIVYACLNIGLILRIWSEPTAVLSAGTSARVLLVLSALLQAAGGVVFAVIMWPRIRPHRARAAKNA